MIDIRDWLQKHGFEQHVQLFEDNEIDGEVLFDLTNDDLKELGLSLGSRKKLLKAIGPVSEHDGHKASETTAVVIGERRQVTVLFADIADFTAMSARIGAEETHDVLNRYFEAADRIVEEFGGSVDKHMGDNVMAVFGAPVAHDNDPERAVRAALAIHEAAAGIMPEAGIGLRLHIGIASGLVVASNTGSDSHREYTVTGESVNLAARLEGLAESGQTLVSETVHKRTSGQFAATQLGRQSIKGIEQPVGVWRIDGNAEAINRGRSSLFVGRRSELGQCKAILEQVAATGEGQTILLRGAAGIGKTRLAEEVLSIARSEKFALHRCLILDFGSRKGQEAVPSLVRSFLGLPGTSDQDQRIQAADKALATGAYAEADRVFLNDLADIPQPADLRRLYNAMDTTARRAGRRALIAGLTAWASKIQPQLILVEDLHWADAQTLDSLAAVMAVATESPVALVATTRPEGDPLEGAWRAVSQERPVSIINLGVLRPSEAKEMAAGFVETNQERLTECLERAAGNPLFLEQLLQNAAESASDAVPGSIQSLVLARMDRLEPLDSQALQAASVLGQRFALPALRNLLASPDYDCAQLLAHQMIRPEGDDFLFAHALIRDGVYESILTVTRSRLHLKAANWFASNDLTLQAEHLHMALDPSAARAYLAAAQSELDKYRYEEAIALLKKGQRLADQEADVVELALTLGHAQHNVGALEEARAAFTAALDSTNDEAVRCRARLGIAGVKRITEDLDGALADLDAAVIAARRLGLVSEHSRACYLRGNIAFPRGDTEACLREHGSALELAREAGSVELEAAALGGLADGEYLGGHYRRACDRFTECVEISYKHGFGRIQVANQPMMAFTLMWCGESERALTVGLEAIETAQRVGHGRAEMLAHNAAFELYRSRGEITLARDHANQALALSRQLGARRFEAMQMTYIAEVDFIQGNQEEALSNVRIALANCRDVGMSFIGPKILGGVALVTNDENERHTAITEAETLLEVGSVSHNYVYFRIFAIEACLRAGEYEAAESHANFLATFSPQENLRLIEFHVDRGRALARVGLGDNSADAIAELDQLILAGDRMLQSLKVADLRRARAGLLK